MSTKTLQKIVYFTFLLSLLVANAHASVIFSPTITTCAPAGCSPVTITNNTAKTILFGGIDMTYSNPDVPLSNFNYTYTGCSNGLIGSGASCDVTINPNGFTINPGTYPIRPKFFRTVGNLASLQAFGGLSFYFDPALTSSHCVTSTTCTTNPNNTCKLTSPPTGGEALINTCVECINSTECAGNPNDKTCKLTSPGSEGPSATNSCVLCISDNPASTTPDSGCPGTGNIKCSSNTSCVECLVNTDCLVGTDTCKQTAGGVEGSAAINTCVTCIQDNPGTTTPDTGCSGTAGVDSIKCNNDNASCVMCLVNADCPPGTPTCSSGTCVI